MKGLRPLSRESSFKTIVQAIPTVTQDLGLHSLIQKKTVAFYNKPRGVIGTYCNPYPHGS